MTMRRAKYILFATVGALLLFLAAWSASVFACPPVDGITAYADVSGAVAASTEESEAALGPLDIFTDYTQTSLKEDYDELRELDAVAAALDAAVYERATDVVEGRVRYTPEREFSTAEGAANVIPQAGDIAAYSTSALNCIWKASDLITTGIYGLTGDTIKVFVRADDPSMLPQIICSQNHGYYNTYEWRRTFDLHEGMNEIVYPDIVAYSSHIDRNEAKGGAIYIVNPYTELQGRADVYIEGGGYYPIMRLGDDEERFLSRLKEYEAARKSDSRMVDMAELEIEHALITTTASSLYETYVDYKAIRPSENLRLWNGYVNAMFEFNGIPLFEGSLPGIDYDERNDYVKINFRYMTYYPGSGAYSYIYHIGWYYEHYWFADFDFALHPFGTHGGLSDHLVYGIGHELGHALDNEPRKINETSNNMSATFAFIKIVGRAPTSQYQPLERTMKELSCDRTLDYGTYDRGKIMYTGGDYDHNYLIWWYLESVFPGFWADLNDMFRDRSQGADISALEKYVYYSSLVTGVDLSDYYERWGFYYATGLKSDLANRFTVAGASEKFAQLMAEATKEGLIEKKYDRFWYADAEEFDFMRAHRDVPEEERVYGGAAPEVTKAVSSGGKHTVYIRGAADDRLGYEIFSKTRDGVWKTAGFTYTSTFVDAYAYDSAPTYKAIAINRYFSTSAESNECAATAEEGTNGVCRVGDNYYDTLLSAMIDAQKGATISLLSDCTLSNYDYYKPLTIEADESAAGDIRIYVGKTYLHMHDDLTIRGRAGARIVIDGGSDEGANPVIYGSGGTFRAEHVTFRDLRTRGNLASAIYAQATKVELCDVRFEHCENTNAAPAVKAYRAVELSDCTFAGTDDAGVWMSDAAALAIGGAVSGLVLDFADFTGEKTIATSIDPQAAISGISLAGDRYMLVPADGAVKVRPCTFVITFRIGGDELKYESASKEFTFGDENFDYGPMSGKYARYTDAESGKTFVTGDATVLVGDMTFDVTVCDMLTLNIRFDGDETVETVAEGSARYLPTADGTGAEVVAYLDGDVVYYAGRMYTVNKNSVLTAVYPGRLTYRYIVDNAVFALGYGSYGDVVTPLDPELDGFVCWQSGGIPVYGDMTLLSDIDLVAAFDGEPPIYSLDGCEVTPEHGSYVYTGVGIEPRVIVTINGFTVPREFYEVTYLDNVAVSAAAKIVVSAVDGKSVGTKTVTFAIEPRPLSKSDVTAEGFGAEFVYDGSETSQSFRLMLGETELAEGRDYSFTYIGDRMNAGTVTVSLSFSGNYSGSFDLTYTIKRAAGSAEVSVADRVYGDPPAEIVVTSDTNPVVGARVYYRLRGDGEYSEAEPTDAGTYEVKVVLAASRNYDECTAYAEFTIRKAAAPPLPADTVLRPSGDVRTLADVALPAGFEWKDDGLAVTESGMTAVAVYVGAGAANYETTEVEFTIVFDAREEGPGKGEGSGNEQGEGEQSGEQSGGGTSEGSDEGPNDGSDDGSEQKPNDTLRMLAYILPPIALALLACVLIVIVIRRRRK